MKALEPAVLATVAVVMFLYLGLLIVIGWRAARRTRTGEDFHLAGRSLGAWAAGISSTASSESGWVTLGAVGMTYAHGVAGLWYAPGCLMGYLVNLYLVAPRIQRLSREQNSLTLTDIVSRRWGDPGHLLRVTSVAIILLSMMGYVAAQMTAAGKAFSSSLFAGWLDESQGYVLGVLIGAAVITLVTSLGGFRGVAWTDLFQGLLMAGALFAVPLWAVIHLGGPAELVRGLAAANPDFLSATGGRVGSAAFGFIVGNLGIGLGYPGMPHVITRYMATRDERQVHRLKLIGILWGVIVFYGAGAVGLAGRVLLPNLADGERALVVLSLELLPAAVAGLILAAVISAILSTVSSQLLVAASAVSYDVVEGALGRHPDDRRSLRLGRLTVAAIGLLGVLLALSDARVVFWFVLFAWSILGASFGPLILLGLTRAAVNRHGAFACMLVGLGVSVAWKLGRDAAEQPGPFAWVPWVTLALALVMLVAGGMSGRIRGGDRVALVVATLVTLAAWGLVQVDGMSLVYELVPAFVLSGLTAIGVSAATRTR